MSQLGLNISRYRRAEGLSAAELSELAGEGLSRSVIANLENGRKDDVTVKQLVALGNALRIPPAALVVDIFNPGADAPYYMPLARGKGFNRETLKIEELESMRRNADFWSWFTGERIIADEPLDGAPKAVMETTNALRGYSRAWSMLTNAVLKYTQLGLVTSDDDEEIQRVQSSRMMDAIEGAVNVVRWSKELTAKGVKTTDIEQQVATLMDKAKIPFNFETDAQEFPDPSSFRWL